MKSKSILVMLSALVVGSSILSNVALIQATAPGEIALLSITSIVGLVGCVFVGKAWADYF